MYVATPTYCKFACMASTDDTALLLDADELNQEGPRSPEEREVSEEDDAILLDVSTPSSISKRRHFLGSELVVAVFVVAFDTKKGNVVEWQFPEEVDLDGVEFRAIASGFHNVNSDFIYFKHHQLFGLSCFEKMSVDSVEERGARMKAVGMLAVGYSDLHTHKTFLQEQTTNLLQNPRSGYATLEQFFWRVQSNRKPSVSRSHSFATADLPPMEITHPSGCFSPFLELYGASVFVLWRMALLKRRILLVSSPPVGLLCYRVYSSCLLATHNLTDVRLDTDSNPVFYINVADIPHISSVNSYIACTTEQIFEDKQNLYDVFVNGDKISCTSQRLDTFLKISSADRLRYSKLSNSIRQQGAYDVDLLLARYFQHLNSEIFRSLLNVSHSEDHVMTLEMVDALGLDPSRDRLFLTELASLHNLNVIIQQQMDVFSCCI